MTEETAQKTAKERRVIPLRVPAAREMEEIRTRMDEFLSGEGQEEAIQEMGRWTRVEYTEESGAKEMKYFINPKGRAAGVIRTKPDGTVTNTELGKNARYLHNQGMDSMIKIPRSEAQTELTKAMAKRFTQEELYQTAINRHTRAWFRSKLRNTADAVVDSACRRILWEGQEMETGSPASKLINQKAALEGMIDPAIVNRLFRKNNVMFYTVTPRQYNDEIRSQSAKRSAQERERERTHPRMQLDTGGSSRETMARNELDFNKMEEAKNRAIRETAEITPSTTPRRRTAAGSSWCWKPRRAKQNAGSK